MVNRYVWFTVVTVFVSVGLLAAIGQDMICPCGDVKVWDGDVKEEDSQHVFDWWSFSHFIKGLLALLLLSYFFPDRSISWYLFVATLVEASWEVIENTPYVIEAMRMTLNTSEYRGDTVLNSFFDIVSMLVGFGYAWRAPTWLTWITILAVEVFTMVAVRVSLFFTIFLFVFPIDVLQAWQVAAW